MIATKHRFHGHGSLKYVYQRGQTDRGSMTALKHVYNSRRDTYRLAVVVSKKVSKSAVVRNRIRRRVYEFFRNEPALAEKTFDLVVTVFDERVADISYGELEKMLHTHLIRAKVI